MERQSIEVIIDFDQILTAYKMHGYTKGAKGIYMALLPMDPPCRHEPEEDPSVNG